MPGTRGHLLLGALAALAALTPSASAATPSLSWQACGGAAGVQCASLRAPLDYDAPGGRTVRVFVAKSSATDKTHRIGSLFINFGGPGASGADVIEAGGAAVFPTLNERFDIVAVDPRGVGQSRPSIDCKVNQEQLGLFAQPFWTPFRLPAGPLLKGPRQYVQTCLARNRSGILEHVSTANVARDMDLVRRALGEARLNYLGFSYGSFLGSTYAALFPRNYRTLAIDGPIDAATHVNHPLRASALQTAAFERAFGRFLRAAGIQRSAYDQLVHRLDSHSLPATGADPRPVDGDDLRAATYLALYNKRGWSLLAQGIAKAQAGDGTLVRLAADQFYFRLTDGTYDPLSDRYFAINAAEQRYPRKLAGYFQAGKRSWQRNPHFFFNHGYSELPYALWPARDRDAFAGPFHLPRSAATPLVVATTHDPVTPYRGAKRLIGELGNGRLLTMIGDGHTAYGNGSPDCIDTRIDSYLITGVLPPTGTRCVQNIPFATGG
jgi:pimeloyl-ACP methyl ester carboxylesterase